MTLCPLLSHWPLCRLLHRLPLCGRGRRLPLHLRSRRGGLRRGGRRSDLDGSSGLRCGSSRRTEAAQQRVDVVSHLGHNGAILKGSVNGRCVSRGVDCRGPRERLSTATIPRPDAPCRGELAGCLL